jgi:hypothetical protein
VHQRPDEQVSTTLVFAILHQEKVNKVFGKRYPCDCSQLSQWVVFHPSQVALRPGIFVVNCVELSLHLSLMTTTMNDFDVDLVPPSPPSASPMTTATIDRYNPHDLILSFILSNMPIYHTSMLYMFDLVHLFYMIYILFLI